jgi:chromosome segregation ATPase
MQLLKEERDREALKASTLQESKESNQAVLTAELNAARAEVLDLQQRLAALQADLDVAKADKDRAITASSNLQRAMEAFESERDAELEILEESRKSAEEAMLAAHELALQALKKDNNRIIEEMQIASNKAIKNMMDEIKDMERKQEEYLRENVNLRRSLDEAIQRLHSKEEDVIDRSLMKNILLDWHSKSGKAKRDVLAVMSSVLHFTEEEKEKCGLIESQHAISKVVGTLAPPLNPAAKSPEELDGDSIREKWVSFLLAECGESPQRSKSSTVTRKRNQRSTEASDI